MRLSRPYAVHSQQTADNFQTFADLLGILDFEKRQEDKATHKYLNACTILQVLNK